MLIKGRHKAKPYLVLVMSVFFTVVAATAAVLHPAPQPQNSLLLFLLIGAFVSLALFLATRSGSRAQIALGDTTEQLRKANESQGQLKSQLEQHRTKLKELISQMPGVVWEMHGTPDTALKLTFISDYVE